MLSIQIAIGKQSWNNRPIRVCGMCVKNTGEPRRREDHFWIKGILEVHNHFNSRNCTNWLKWSRIQKTHMNRLDMLHSLHPVGFWFAYTKKNFKVNLFDLRGNFLKPRTMKTALITEEVKEWQRIKSVRAFLAFEWSNGRLEIPSSRGVRITFNSSKTVNDRFGTNTK